MNGTRTGQGAGAFLASTADSVVLMDPRHSKVADNGIDQADREKDKVP